jgi:hypothetical protein
MQSPSNNPAQPIPSQPTSSPPRARDPNATPAQDRSVIRRVRFDISVPSPSPPTPKEEVENVGGNTYHSLSINTRLTINIVIMARQPRIHNPIPPSAFTPPTRKTATTTACPRESLSQDLKKGTAEEYTDSDSDTNSEETSDTDDAEDSCHIDSCWACGCDLEVKSPLFPFSWKKSLYNNLNVVHAIYPLMFRLPNAKLNISSAHRSFGLFIFFCVGRSLGKGRR